MLIAQLSDPHFMPPDVRLFGRLDTAAYLERAVEHLNALEPDVVLITGDLTNDGDEQVYAAFAAIVSGLRAPFFVLAGNHDDRELVRARFARPSAGQRVALLRDRPVRGAPDRARHAGRRASPGGGSGRSSSTGSMRGFARCRTGLRWWRCITRRFAPASAISTARCCAMPTRWPR